MLLAKCNYFQIFLKKILKFLLCHWIFGLKAIFLLMSLLNHSFIVKQYSKMDLYWLIGFNNFEKVFILFAKIITI